MTMLQDRVVVLTGASAGVGRAIAEAFARTGTRIGLIARDEEALADVKKDVERLGGSAVIAPADVADADAVFAAAAAIERDLGPIDFWINDAMATVFSPVWAMTPAEFHRVTDVTYHGVVHGTMAALRHMRPRHHGTIIQIGSALAYRAIPLQSAYCGAKHAIRGFTNSVRSELLHEASAIRISIVELPAVNTPQFDWARTHMPRWPRPVPPVVQPEVIGRAVVRAATLPHREYWIGLTTLKVILGNMLVPAGMDRYLARHAFESQETSQPVEQNRKDNLFFPVHELHRTRGRFDDEAADEALVVTGSLSRLISVAAGALLFFAIGAFAAAAAKARSVREPARPQARSPDL